MSWINQEKPTDPVLDAAIAHLWFATIHPFDDGNGRIGRAITDMMLARADGTPYRFYSLSQNIMLNRESYYAVLEETQKGDGDITEWLRWFIRCLENAVVSSDESTNRVVRKNQFADGGGRSTHYVLNNGF